jgi:ADP-ribose pyrophosphatase
VGRREVWRNGHWIVYSDDIEDQSGNGVRNYISLAGTTPAEDLVTGVAVLPVQGAVVGLLASYRHPVERAGWEVVKGFIDAGETPLEAAHRELLEETGCVAGELIPFGYVMPEASTLAARSALFVALECRTTRPAVTDEPGLGALRWLPIEEAMTLLNRFGVEDAFTMLCLLHYDRLRRGRLG